jgi:hypothetical protein
MTYNKFSLGSILVWMACMIPTPITATSLELTWNANTESDIAGYMVYYGNTSVIYTSFKDVGNVTSYEISNVTEGKTYYVTLSAYNTSGYKSANSQEVYIYVPISTATPSILLLSPIVGTVLSKPPTLSWSATSLTTFTLYMALDNGSYYKMYSGKKTSYSLSSHFWYLFIPSGATMKWYVVGVASSGQQVSSVVSYFKKL